MQISESKPEAVFHLLADTTRLHTLMLLDAVPALCVCHLVDLLGVPQSRVSRHLGLLRGRNFVLDSRQGSWVAYRLNPALPLWVRETLHLARLHWQTGAVGQAALTAARQAQHASLCMPAETLQPPAEPRAPYQVLFLCTANSARSLIAEALLRRWGGGRFVAHSAGSVPGAAAHPLALQVLRSVGLDISALQPKGWQTFSGPDAPRLDFVFTVCDTLAGQLCPPWPGQPVTAHWGTPDPAQASGSEAEQLAAFEHALRALDARICLFTQLPIEALDRLSLQREMQDIGRVEVD